jgi:hypothetical protein
MRDWLEDGARCCNHKAATLCSNLLKLEPALLTRSLREEDGHDPAFAAQRAFSVSRPLAPGICLHVRVCFDPLAGHGDRVIPQILSDGLHRLPLLWFSVS